MDRELLNYNYIELLKTIKTLSLPASEQKKIMGYGNVGEDMLIDFETYFTYMKEL